ncbi:MAG: hypothetical protein HY051_02940 [Candidatus Aenigmarchaeota archaeon]|nr:hypothetical protein [Candidatus Aenigmarchaeota archaeon]
MTFYQELLNETIRYWRATAPSKEIAELYYVWAVAPALDALYFARTTQNYAQELAQLLQGSRSEDRFFYNQPIEEGPSVPQNTGCISREFIDPDRKVFRMYEGDTPSVQAIDLGLRLLFVNSAQRPQIVSSDFHSILAACGQFVRKAYIEPEKAYSLSEWRNPGVFGIFSSVSAIRTYNQAREHFSVLPNIEFPLETVADTLLRQDFTYEDSVTFGFRDTGAEEPCLSVTEQAYRVCIILGELLGKDNPSYRNLLAQLRAKGPKVARLLQYCWDKNSGGFRRNRKDDQIPDLLHTRYALQLVRALLSMEAIKPNGDDLAWLDSAGPLRFLHSCLSDGAVTNFSTVDSLPSVCSERFGLNTLKVIYLLVEGKGLGSSPEYLGLVSSLVQEVLPNVTQFLATCKLPDSGLYMAFPYQHEAMFGKEIPDRFISPRSHNIDQEGGIVGAAEWWKLYRELVTEYGVPELPREALRSLAEDKGGMDFLTGWRFYLRDKDRLLKTYPRQYVAISGESVIAVAPTSGQLTRKLPPEYRGRPLFTVLLTEAELSHIPDLEFWHEDE